MDSQWLRLQFALHPEKSKANLAEKLGLEASAISKILKGTRQIKAHEYVGMREFFGMPNDGKAALQNRENHYALEPLGHTSFEEKGSRDTDAERWIIPAKILGNKTETPQEQIKFFEVRENVMEPDFKKGEHVLVDISATKPSPPGIFVISDGFGQMLRHCEYVPKSQPPEIKISALNNNFEPQMLKKDDFEIIGRVIAKLEWL